MTNVVNTKEKAKAADKQNGGENDDSAGDADADADAAPADFLIKHRLNSCCMSRISVFL